ncbi:hypothetical protein [Pontivivens ytuae]|uniref:Uncharacterized protein n=1 Tax=Pontivivens ytuae TaxID=2789856 RepID=A0A7S9QB27_9RHOB|nr:hypothetical protein [Pontivivens ytuae]QPH52418.1 hypothetical protein I0K15_11335 [Pontivivens ytuae]
MPAATDIYDTLREHHPEEAELRALQLASELVERAAYALARSSDANGVTSLMLIAAELDRFASQRLAAER